MVHAAGHQAVTTRGNVPCLRWIESVSSTNAERTFQDDDILVLWMPVRSHLVPIGTSEANRERDSHLERVTLERAYCKELPGSTDAVPRATPAGGSLHLISPGVMIWIVAPALGKGFGDPPDWATSQAPPVINPANTIDDAYLTRMTDPLLAKNEHFSVRFTHRSHPRRRSAASEGTGQRASGARRRVRHLLGGSSRTVIGGSHIVAPASLSEQQNGDAKHDRHVCHIEDARS